MLSAIHLKFWTHHWLPYLLTATPGTLPLLAFGADLSGVYPALLDLNRALEAKASSLDSALNESFGVALQSRCASAINFCAKGEPALVFPSRCI